MFLDPVKFEEKAKEKLNDLIVFDPHKYTNSKEYLEEYDKYMEAKEVLNESK